MRFLTAGESHGKGLMGILEGVPLGLCLLKEDIQKQLNRRQRYYGRSQRMSMESDSLEILSGIRDGQTTGAPIAFFIKNADNRLENEGMPPITRPRPGHADLAGMAKYGVLDARNIAERASGRETATRVVIGEIARQILRELGITVAGYVTEIGGERSGISYYNGGLPYNFEKIRENCSVGCLDSNAAEKMFARIDEAKRDGDTLGGAIEVVVSGLESGYGSLMMFDTRLDYKIGGMMMSIPSVKAVKIGNESAQLLCGSGSVDPIIERDGKLQRLTNFSGGIEGGMSNGEQIVVSITVKPPPTLKNGVDTVDFATFQAARAHFERSDICIVPTVSVVAESVLSYVICDTVLTELGGDTLQTIKMRYNNRCEEQENVLNKNRK